MLSTNWKIGKVFGIPVFLDLSFFIAFSFFSASLSGLFEGPVTVKVLFGMAATSMLFGSVLLHELGHCVAARVVGEEPSRITLFFLGGVASLKGLGKSPAAAFLIAVCGPLVSALLGVAFLLLKPEVAGNWREVVTYGSYINIALCLFNLLPIVPLDGGRVVVACVWGILDGRFTQGMEGYFRASDAAVTWIGRPLLFGAVGVLLWKSQLTVWFGVLGLYLLLLMSSEQHLARRILPLAGKKAENVMLPLVLVSTEQDIAASVQEGACYIGQRDRGSLSSVFAVRRDASGNFEEFVEQRVLGEVSPDKPLIDLAAETAFGSLKGVWLVAHPYAKLSPLGVVPSVVTSP